MTSGTGCRAACPLSSLVALVALVTLAACEPTETQKLSKTATVQGQFDSPKGLGGSAWLFLYKPNEGPPGGPAVPAFVTAISAARLSDDRHFVFSEVAPNPWKLFGLLDTDGNFDPNVDVLSQPSAGDRVGEGVQINVQPGRGATADYSAYTLVKTEPPAFHLQEARSGAVNLVFDAMTPVTLVADAVGTFEPTKTQFRLALVDANGDGRPDVGSDNVPVLSLTVLLRWLPRPGQAAAGTNVVVPTAFNPAPFLTSLNGDLTATVFADTLQAFPLPQAQSVSTDAKGVTTTAVYGAPPFGDYELLVVSQGAQFWRLPNQLGTKVDSQSVRLFSLRAP